MYIIKLEKLFFKKMIQALEKLQRKNEYTIWCYGVDELYSLYENDFASYIAEIEYYHYRIYCNNGLTIDFFPSSRRMCNLGTKKWYTIPPHELKKQIEKLTP